MKLINKLCNIIVCIFLLTGCVDQKANTESSTSELDTLKDKITENSRIVATSVATLTICSMLEIELVATPSSDNYQIPEIYEGLPIIGNSMAVDIEVLDSLNVDLVISPKSLENDLKDKYESIGVDYLFIDLTSVDLLYQSMDDIAYIFDKEDLSNVFVSDYENFKESLKSENNYNPSVLVLMGLPGSYVVATNKSYVGSLASLSGFENVYGDYDEAFLNINIEDMLVHNPDYIFITAHAMPDMVMEMFDDEFNNNAIWSNFNAVKHNKVIKLDHNYFGMSANFSYPDAINFLLEILKDGE